MIPDPELTALLGGGESFRLHRGRRAGTGAPVLVKAARHEPAPAADIAALRRECELIKGLHSAGDLQPRMVEGPAGASLVPTQLPGNRTAPKRAFGDADRRPRNGIGVPIAAAGRMSC